MEICIRLESQDFDLKECLGISDLEPDGAIELTDSVQLKLTDETARLGVSESTLILEFVATAVSSVGYGVIASTIHQFLSGSGRRETPNVNITINNYHIGSLSVREIEQSLAGKE